ncbi:MAG TPA: twin-arginine translocase subunit TatC [Alphaproteobacteria bacterium]
MNDVYPPLPAQPLIGHIIELRKRLLICAVFFCIAVGVCYLYAEQIYAFLLHPLEVAMHGKNRRLIYTGLTEAFMTYMKVAFFAGGILTLPMVLLQVWRFIAPGLFDHERRAVLPFIIATPLLFIAGLAMAFYGIIPVAWEFFTSFETNGQVSGSLPIVMETRLSEYLSLTMTLLVIFGVAFELPVFMGLLAKTGLIKADALSKNRKYAFLVILVVAAILSPPDVISQTGLAVPLYGLYEVSILVVRWMEKQKIVPADSEIIDA